MSSILWSKAFIAGCGLAVGLSAACNRDEAAEVDRNTDSLAADTSSQQGHEGAPITVTGCLQRGSGLNNYILTQVNTPSDTPVATSGNSNGAAVQREQMREAKHSYVLDGDDTNAMRSLIGKQVRVTGKIDETSQLRRGTTDGQRREGLDIAAGDLTKVDVQGIVQVADVCGDAR